MICPWTKKSNSKYTFSKTNVSDFEYKDVLHLYVNLDNVLAYLESVSSGQERGHQVS